MNYRQWLPTTQQMSDALQLRSEAFREASMQQSLGMILLTGWIAGIIPFVVNWIRAARVGTALPLVELAQREGGLAAVLGRQAIPDPWMQVLSDLFGRLAGIEPALPGWLAAGLSALGQWLSVPLDWLQFWLLFGLFVVGTSRALGATMTLQRFFGATGFFAVPLILTGIGVLPYVGWLVNLIALLWACLIYVRAVEAITGLDRVRCLVSILLPLALLALLLLSAIAVGLVARLALG